MFVFLLINHWLVFANTFYFMQHPLEKRIGYIYGLRDVTRVNDYSMEALLTIFIRHPLLVFKDCIPVNPPQLIDFVKRFDPDHDADAIHKPDSYPKQMLQPFVPFSEYKHMVSWGRVEKSNQYMWQSDFFGHPTKLPNVVTGLYFVEQPVIGGETDFISSETIYEHLTDIERNAAKNMLAVVNQRKFLFNLTKTDYAGANRLEPFELIEEADNVKIPIVYAPDEENGVIGRGSIGPRVNILPSFFETIDGWTPNDSRLWMGDFMKTKVLVHRIGMQWKRGDLVVFNNRRFMYSRTPSWNSNDTLFCDGRLVLKTFIPTKRPLLAYVPNKNIDAAYRAGWQGDLHVASAAAVKHMKYASGKRWNRVNNHLVDNHLVDNHLVDNDMNYVVRSYFR